MATQMEETPSLQGETQTPVTKRKITLTLPDEAQTPVNRLTMVAH